MTDATTAATPGAPAATPRWPSWSGIQTVPGCGQPGQVAVLAERQSGVLAALGRRAEDLAALFELPVKRVRALLQHHRAPGRDRPQP